MQLLNDKCVAIDWQEKPLKLLGQWKHDLIIALVKESELRATRSRPPRRMEHSVLGYSLVVWFYTNKPTSRGNLVSNQ